MFVSGHTISSPRREGTKMWRSSRITKEKVEILILPFEASVTGRSPPVTGVLHNVKCWSGPKNCCQTVVRMMGTLMFPWVNAKSGDFWTVNRIQCFPYGITAASCRFIVGWQSNACVPVTKDLGYITDRDSLWYSDRRKSLTKFVDLCIFNPWKIQKFFPYIINIWFCRHILFFIAQNLSTHTVRLYIPFFQFKKAFFCMFSHWNHSIEVSDFGSFV